MKGILPLLLVLPLATIGFAQEKARTGDDAPFAAVQGTVRDLHGARVPGVTITATEASTRVLSSTVTDENGVFRFPSLQSGTYKLAASLSGFQNANHNGVRVGAMPELIVDFTLKMAKASQGVRPAAPLDLPRDLPQRAERPARPVPQAVPKANASISRVAVR
jgi:hypothetical protein